VETENIRNILCFWGVIGVIVWSALSFNKVTKREEFKPLLDSGQRISLNLFTLLSAYLRRNDDPLKAAHKKISKIGIRYFAAMIVGIILVPTSIIIILLATGIR
jgi:hypothetical protein